MALSTLFKPQRELVSYDYYDIAEGTGYNVFYGFKADNGEYATTTISSLYSEELISYKMDQAVTSSAVQHFDIDFDVVFNRPKNVKGKILANVPIGVQGADILPNMNIKYYAVVKAYHYDGATETLLGTGTSREAYAQELDLGGYCYSTMNAVCIINLTTLRHFKKGEILRFTVEGWFYEVVTTEGLAIHMMIAHDPAGRIVDGTTTSDYAIRSLKFANCFDQTDYLHSPSQMSFHVPFVLDV